MKLCLLGTLKQPGEDVGYHRQVSHHSGSQDLSNRGKEHCGQESCTDNREVMTKNHNYCGFGIGFICDWLRVTGKLICRLTKPSGKHQLTPEICAVDTHNGSASASSVQAEHRSKRLNRAGSKVEGLTVLGPSTARPGFSTPPTPGFKPNIHTRC